MLHCTCGLELLGTRQCALGSFVSLHKIFPTNLVRFSSFRSEGSCLRILVAAMSSFTLSLGSSHTATTALSLPFAWAHTYVG